MNNSYSQKTESNLSIGREIKKQTFLDRIAINQSFDSKHTKTEPASINIILPKDTTSNSFNLNLGIGINILNENSLISLSPFYEIKKNTLISKEQNVRKFGITATWDVQNVFQKKWTPVIFTKVNHKNDKVLNSKSVEGQLYFTPIFLEPTGELKYFFIPDRITDLGLIHFNYNPYLGIEYENKFDTETEEKEGISRLYTRLKLQILILPRILENRLTIDYNYFYRYDFKNSDNFESRNHQLNKVSIAYKFSKFRKNGSASIAVDYTNGENPSDGFKEQEFYGITFKVKL